jgi:D-proline reductase (dithiol) PrdB
LARLDDIPEPTRTAVRDLPCPRFDTMPFVTGSPLSHRRVALISSAALVRPGEAPFALGSGEARSVPGLPDALSLLTSHVSINFDRSGFQRDLNVAFPIERLHQLAGQGLIGSVADTHYTVMGSTDPAEMSVSIETMAAGLHADRVTATVLLPV